MYSTLYIFYYSNYEVETIKNLGIFYDTPILKINDLLSRLIDLHQEVLKSVIFPVENYSLKTIANWLGFYWRDPYNGNMVKNRVLIAGDQSIVWYDQWLKTGDRSFLQYILRYNEDDCLATYSLQKWLVNYFNFLKNE